MSKYYTPEPIKSAGEDLQEALVGDSLTIPQGETLYLPSGDQVGVNTLTVETNATFVVDGAVEVFDSITDNGTITGSGDVTMRNI